MAFDAVHRHNTADGRLFGVKASANQLLTLYRWGGLAAFGTVRNIRITRRDLIAQAVSLSIARQSRQWSSAQPAQAQAQATFRPDDILTKAEAIAEQLRLQDIILTTLDLPVLDLTYEDLTTDPAVTLSRVMRHFGLPDDLPPPQTGLARQADSRNADFIARIRAHLRAAMAGAQALSRCAPPPNRRCRSKAPRIPPIPQRAAAPNAARSPRRRPRPARGQTAPPRSADHPPPS
jgi:hypothetical protein